MKLRARAALPLALGLCGLEGFASLGAAYGQSLSSPSAASMPTPSWSAANLPGATVYQDKYIGGGSLVPDISTGDEAGSDSPGLARSLQVDGVVSALGSREGGASTNVVETGIVVKSQWETADFGAWSLDASARTG